MIISPMPKITLYLSPLLFYGSLRDDKCCGLRVCELGLKRFQKTGYVSVTCSDTYTRNADTQNLLKNFVRFWAKFSRIIDIITKFKRLLHKIWFWTRQNSGFQNDFVKKCNQVGVVGALRRPVRILFVRRAMLNELS